jgi:hypothetical protein
MLLHVHLYRSSLPSSLHALKEKVIIIFSFLASQFLKFQGNAKYSILMTSTTFLIQSIKQATMSNVSVNDLFFTTSFSKIGIHNVRFRVLGENKVLSNSQITAQFHVFLYDCNEEITSLQVETENSEDNENDINMLLHRKHRNNEGDRQNLHLASTSYYSEVLGSFKSEILP